LWPFEEINRFHGENRYYSGESLVSEINPYEKEYIISRNAAIDRNTISLSPPTFIWKRAQFTPSTHRQVGQTHMVSVPPQEAVFTPPTPDLASGFNFDAQTMESKADDIAGLPNLRSLGSYGQPPTAEQVQQIVAPPNAVLQFEISQWLDFFGRIFKHAQLLRKQFLFDDDEGSVRFPTMGANAEFMELAAADFEGEFIILAGGDASRDNPTLEAQKQFAVVQMATQPQNAPFFNQYEALHQWATDYVGYQKAQAMMRPKQEAEELNAKFMDQVAQNVAAQQVKASGNRGGGSRNGAGSRRLQQIPNSGSGIFPKSI